MIKTLAAAGIVISTMAFGAFVASAATAVPAMMGDTAKGKAWVDGKGMALYTFAKDKADKSNCNGKCAVEWPPLAVAAGAKASGDWTIVARDDGSKMWAFKGHPLYAFVDDKKPGQVTGDGKDGFHLAM